MEEKKLPIEEKQVEEKSEEVIEKTAPEEKTQEEQTTVEEKPQEEKVEEVKEEKVEEPKIDKDKAITLVNGEYEKEVEFVNIIPSNLNNNAYLIYTKNEKDETGKIKLYVAILKLGEEGLELSDITNEEEYNKVLEEINNITGEENGK